MGGARAYVLAAAALLGAMLLAALVLVVAAESGPTPPPRVARPAVLRRGDEVSVAGSGSNIALTRRIVDAYLATRPHERVIVHESIGTGGGIRALREGSIDVAMASRELSRTERAGLRVAPYARTAVVFAVQRDRPERDITRASLIAHFRGEERRFVPVLRELGDSGVRSLDRELADPQIEAARAGTWEVFYSDQQMAHALEEVPRALGIFDLGQIRVRGSPLRALSVDGVEPTSPDYPFHKELALVIRADAPERIARLVEFVSSEQAQRLIAESGYELP